MIHITIHTCKIHKNKTHTCNVKIPDKAIIKSDCKWLDYTFYHKRETGLQGTLEWLFFR